MNFDNIMKLSDAETRMVTAENVYGEKGKGAMAEVAATAQPEVERIGQVWGGAEHSGRPGRAHPSRDLGRGWKVRPCIRLPAGATTTIMDVAGPGIIQHIWIGVAGAHYRDLILEMTWDEEDDPSVVCPLGDFFCNGFNQPVDIAAVPINVNPSGGNNCYFPMPFRKHAKLTVQNRAPDTVGGFFYAITYCLTELGDKDAYFHAQFRRTNPLPYRSEYTIVDGVTGKGHYVGTYMAWQQNNTGWWGEGEVKFYLDGDKEFPTLCGTGTEDYFGGAWSFKRNYSAPYLGYPLGASDGKPGNRHGLYRFHIPDPIRFHSDLRVTMQALGWRSEKRYLPLQDDIASVAYWYQAEPHAPFPALGTRDELEVV